MDVKKVEEVPTIAVSRDVSPRTKDIIEALNGMKKGTIIALSEKDVPFRQIHASYQTAKKRLPEAEFICKKRAETIYVERVK